MTVRSAPLLVAAIACLTAPALAQDERAVAPPLPALDPAPADVPVASAPLVAPAREGGWQGEWQGEWAEDGTYHGTWRGTYSDPGPNATRVIYPGAAAGSLPTTGYSAVERAAWLNQCRNVYYPDSTATGAVVAAGTDICESYLAQYEQSYAMAAQATVPGPGATRAIYPGGVPGAYAAPYGYGYPYGAPVIWVRVPIIRQSVDAGE